MQKPECFQPPPPPGPNGVLTAFASSSQSGSFLPPTPPRSAFNNTQAAQSIAGMGAFGGMGGMGGMGSFTGFNDSPDLTNNNIGGYYGSSPAAAAAYNGSGGAYGLGGGMYGASPGQLPPAFPAADLMHSSSNVYNEQQQLGRPTGPAQSASRAISTMLQQQRLQQFGSLHEASMGAAAGGLPPAYHANPLSRAATVSAQQLLQQQQQIGRSFSIDVDLSAGIGGYGGAYGAGVMGRWGSGAGRLGEYGGLEQGRVFGAVYDMKSLTAGLSHVQAGTGDVRRMLASCTFRPRLPGLTKLVSQLSREGNWAKALEVYESLDAVGVRPDTTITNAAISACDKGSQWEKALQVFRSMSDLGLDRDAITYSALISALSKGRQWSLAIDVFNHMVAEGVECDAVTCCSLITALDKGGQWQLAEQVFIQMYQAHTQFHVLLEGMQQDNNAASDRPDKPLTTSPSSLLAGTFSAAAFNALTIQEERLPAADQPASLMVSGPSGPPGLIAGGTDRTEASGELYRMRTAGKLRPTAAAAAAAVQAGDKKKASSSSSKTLLPAASLMDFDVAAASLGRSGSSLASPGSDQTCCQDLPGCLSSTSNSSNMNISSSSRSSGARTYKDSLAGPDTSTPAAATAKLTTAGSSTIRPTEASPRASPDSPDIAAASLISPGSSLASPDSSPGCQDSEGQLVRTISAAWSRVIGANRAAAGSNGVIIGTSASVAECRGRNGSGDSNLSASDAIVILADTRAVEASDQGSQQQQQQQNTPPASVMIKSLTDQLVDVGLPPPTTAAAAAIKEEDDKPAAAAEAPAGSGSAAAAAGSPGRLGRSPTAPARHMFSSMIGPNSGLSPLYRGPSTQFAGSGSPIGLKIGRAGSLNSKKSSPNRVCCNALLAAYARAVPARWKQALKLLEVMWQCGGELVPDIVSYNTVMKACGNAQQTDIAFQLYHHMQKRGIEPTVATYGTLVTIASEAQDYSKVKESWGWLQASGLPVHVTCVNSYLTALIKEDNWDAAVDLFNQLKSNQLGVRPNSVTYNILMSACLARDKPQTVKALFDEMTAASLSPTLISFNTLLHAFGKMGAWQESLALMTHLCGSSVVRPSATSFNTVFCTLSNVAAAVGDFDKQTICSKALEVYGLMLNQPGVHPDTALYRNMVATFTACKAPQMVLQLALTMSQQGHSLDPITAAAALEALQHEGSWVVAGQLLRSCYAAGALVSHVVLEQVLVACAGSGAWKAAKEVLQVSASAGQLDSVAQLLQHYRTQIQNAHSTGQLNPTIPSGIIDPDNLDELLFLTYLQAQYDTGGWAQGLELFKQLKAGRGLGFAAGNAAVHGMLLELLVVRGGVEGIVAAVQIVDECHVSGAMAHYIIHPNTRTSPTASQACTSPPNVTNNITDSAISSGLLSPEQQLILQLEQAAISKSSPQAAAAAAGGSLLSPENFGFGQVTGSIPASFGMAASASNFLGSEGLVQGTGAGAEGLAAQLSFLDVQGCSCIEAVVLLLSYLGQIVQAQTNGSALAVEYIKVSTGSAGAVSQVELDQIKLYKPVGSGKISVASSVSSTAAAAAAESPPAAAAAAAAAGSSGNVDHKGSSSGGGTSAAPVAVTSSGSTACKDTVPTTADAVIATTTSAAAAAAVPISTSSDWEVPGSHISIHAAVLAVLNGQISSILGCSSAMDLLVPFSGCGRLVLGLLCCSPMPVLLPDESQGGGVWLGVADLKQSINAALDAARS